MKRLLIVSDPPAAPGYLPRLRHLCEYLVQKGFDVTLLTEANEPLPFAHTYPIETIRMYRGGSFEWFIKTVWTLLTNWHNRAFAKRAISNFRSQSVPSREAEPGSFRALLRRRVPGFLHGGALGGERFLKRVAGCLPKRVRRRPASVLDGFGLRAAGGTRDAS